MQDKEVMEGCRMVIIADDLERTITHQLWADDWTKEYSELLGHVTHPYPMSHHVDDLGCDMRCVRDNNYLLMDSCSRCMEGGIKWQDAKNVTANM